MTESIDQVFTEGDIRIARLQFADLPQAETRRIDEALADHDPSSRLYNTEDTTPIIYAGESHTITRLALYKARIYTNADIDEDEQYHRVIRAYLSCISRYVQRTRTRTRAEAANPPLRVTFIQDSAFFEEIQSQGVDSPYVANILEGAGCRDGEAFMKLDYIFIPWCVGASHWVMYGIAPKQHFIFVLDPIFQTFDFHWRQNINLLEQMTSMIIANVNSTGFDQWHAITPTYNNMANDWRARIIVTQTDFQSCGVIAVTNSLCLAFGYPLLCYSNNRRYNDMQNKRKRMCIELLTGCFAPPYDYPLLEVPGRWMEWPTQLTEPRTRKGWRGNENGSENDDDLGDEDGDVNMDEDDEGDDNDDSDESQSNGSDKGPYQIPHYMGRRPGLLGAVRKTKKKNIDKSKKTIKIKKASAAAFKVKMVQLQKLKMKEMVKDSEKFSKAEKQIVEGVINKKLAMSVQEGEHPLAEYPLYTGTSWPRQFPKEFFEARVLTRIGNGLQAKIAIASMEDLIKICRSDKIMFRGFMVVKKRGLEALREWMKEALANDR